ncbi:hypothetical protein M2139_000590 [Enterococcus sp. PF1-24]|uniref:hypothetical protein n=1 Tax=unclassified Enterococcus TaxID=2608891 RepID=UPI00247539B3|nr:MULTISPECIES: hypothetical protein [unclassified Enterococcus]MDH6363753.1 magnesium-transporting ATPase (P-type) [Enterococcus sp. PFB1-1]MDH6400709.1 hypothetical protein [Enterococcus sp. PF1-24]
MKPTNTNTATTTVAPIEFLWLGLYAFAGFALEWLLSLVVNIFSKEPLNKNITLLLTAILWLGAFSFLYLYTKKKFNFDIFTFKVHLSKDKLIFIGGLILITIIITCFGFGGFKPWIEYHSLDKKLATYLLQVLYYFAESLLIVLTIALGQHFFEEQFRLSAKLPSGGLFLALTWGLMHFFLQGISGGFYAMFFALIAGTIYVVCKKDFPLSYLFIAIAFIL